MKNAVILHGTDGSPNGNWFLWLKKELQNKGYKVWLPQLPDCDYPNVDKYNTFLLSGWGYNEKTVLIGHSSGAVEILSLLQNLPDNIVIDKAILVAGFINDLGWKELKGMFIHKFVWKLIKTRAKHFIFIHSDDDPYVALNHGKILYEKLGGKLIIKEGQKHFSIDTAGQKYKKFPLLLKLID